MKLEVTTVYDDFNEAWLDWWLTRFRDMPEYTTLEDFLNKKGEFVLNNRFEDKEFGCNVIGKTTYRLTRKGES